MLCITQELSHVMDVALSQFIYSKALATPASPSDDGSISAAPTPRKALTPECT